MFWIVRRCFLANRTAVLQIVVNGELVEVFEMPVEDVEGHQMLAKANEDERAIDWKGHDIEDGELWVHLEALTK